MEYKITKAARAGYAVYENGELVAATSTLEQAASAVAGVAPTNPHDLADLITACAPEGHANKISMIKLYRQLTGSGLREAKDAIEASLMRKRNVW